MAQDQPRFFPELEGIRGYAFVIVFLVHYLFAGLRQTSRTQWLRWSLELSWVCVPIFFVLSGFLITAILLRTKGKIGYFRVFYARRAFRVLPLYYAVIAVVTIAALLKGNFPATFLWSHTLFIQNLSPAHFLAPPRAGRTTLVIGHLWSLAIEEQFYLVWPLVVWACRSRAALLRCCYAGTAAVCVIRIASPALGITPAASYFHTATRVDALLLGAMLAVWHGTPAFHRAQRLAPWLAIGGMGVLAAALVFSGSCLPTVHWRVYALTPVVNIAAFGFTVRAMKEGGQFQRFCQYRWACWLGSLSYGCYVFHQLYLDLFISRMLPMLTAHMRAAAALAITACAAFALTLALALLANWLIEKPAMQFRKRFRYGPTEAKSSGTLLGWPALKPNKSTAAVNAPGLVLISFD